jgi:UDP-N-acetyl-D-glucosamine dehydrogenase
MPNHVVRRVVELLNDRGITLSNAEVLVLGVAYKSDVSDTRESPAIDIIEYLNDWKASVTYHDPYVPELTIPQGSYESVELTTERLADADCVLLVTDHSEFDIVKIVNHASLVFDTRNVTEGNEGEHIVRL